jgi:hypothetical protein
VRWSPSPNGGTRDWWQSRGSAGGEGQRISAGDGGDGRQVRDLGGGGFGGGRGDSSPTRLEEVGEGDRGAGGGEARGCAASTADGAGGAIGPQRDTWRPMLRITDDPSRVKVVLHIMLFRTRFSIFFLFTSYF